jgi:hypothetical protein
MAKDLRLSIQILIEEPLRLKRLQLLIRWFERAALIV